MRSLIVEDEFTSRKILHRLLSEFGEVDVAVNGVEAVEALRAAATEDERYDLLCLDIMLPDLNGQEVLGLLRELEGERGVVLGAGAKVIMTTSLKDKANVMSAFRQGAESYMVKPITREGILEQLRKLGLSEAA